MKTWVIEKFIRWKIWRYECDLFFFRKMLGIVQADLADLAKEARRLKLEETNFLLLQTVAKISILKHKKDLQ